MKSATVLRKVYPPPSPAMPVPCEWAQYTERLRVLVGQIQGSLRMDLDSLHADMADAVRRQARGRA